MTQKQPEGQFTIPTRVYLSDAQREKLFVLARDHGVDLPDLLTELLAAFLDHLPDEESPAAPASESDSDLAHEIGQRRAELRRLRARATVGGSAAPPWLARYIADLESELARLEREVGG
jgi:HPt (histidine-containing phosphotransfer) domain-containing protein